MPNPKEYKPPTIEQWPDYSEHFDEETFNQMRDLIDATPEELQRRSSKLEEEFRGMTLGNLAITADRVVDAYYKTKSEARSARREFLVLKASAKDEGRSLSEVTMPSHLTETHVDVYARALLKSLVYMPRTPFPALKKQSSVPTPPDKKDAEDIAFRLVKGVHVANGGDTRGMSSVGLAAELSLRTNWPAHYGKSQPT